MKKDLLNFGLQSSFLSCEKDAETILRKLLIESRPYSDDLKRLLVINTKDCFDKNNPLYQKKIEEMSLSKLMEGGYIQLVPKILMPEHEETKSYIILTFDSFVPSGNPQFRDCIVSFDILCHTDQWDIGDYQLRPFKIAGYIDAILNNAKLSGIGTLNFMGCKQLLLNQELGGYSLNYIATHGSDDSIPPVEE